MHARTVRLGSVGVNRVRKFAVPEIFPPTGTAPNAHDQGRIEDPAKDAGTSQDRGAILRVRNGGMQDENIIYKSTPSRLVETVASHPSRTSTCESLLR